MKTGTTATHTSKLIICRGLSRVSTEFLGGRITEGPPGTSGDGSLNQRNDGAKTRRFSGPKAKPARASALAGCKLAPGIIYPRGFSSRKMSDKRKSELR